MDPTTAAVIAKAAIAAGSSRPSQASAATGLLGAASGWQAARWANTNASRAAPR